MIVGRKNVIFSKCIYMIRKKGVCAKRMNATLFLLLESEHPHHFFLSAG